MVFHEEIGGLATRTSRCVCRCVRSQGSSPGKGTPPGEQVRPVPSSLGFVCRSLENTAGPSHLSCLPPPSLWSCHQLTGAKWFQVLTPSTSSSFGTASTLVMGLNLPPSKHELLTPKLSLAQGRCHVFPTCIYLTSGRFQFVMKLHGMVSCPSSSLPRCALLRNTEPTYILIVIFERDSEGVFETGHSFFTWPDKVLRGNCLPIICQIQKVLLWP